MATSLYMYDCTTFFSIKLNIHQTLMRDWLWPVHYSRTILQKQFRKMSGMRQPPWPSGSRDYRTDHLLCIMTPRPFNPHGHAEPRSFAHPRKRASPLAHTHAHITPPSTTDVSRSAITIISMIWWLTGSSHRYFPFALHVNFIHKNVRSTTRINIQLYRNYGERVLLFLRVAFLNPDWIWCELLGISSARSDWKKFYWKRGILLQYDRDKIMRYVKACEWNSKDGMICIVLYRCLSF